MTELNNNNCYIYLNTYLYGMYYVYVFPNKSYNGVMEFKRLRFGMCF